MAKTKTITLDNYKQFKPSELVHSFVSDLDVALKSGKPMNMDTFEKTEAQARGCLPCLGGMALLNFGCPNYYNAGKVLSNIADLGDYIRMSNWRYALDKLIDTYPEYSLQLSTVDTRKLPAFASWSGTVHADRIKALQKHVLKFVEVLEKAGC